MKYNYWYSAFDKSCSKWLHEREITKVKVSQNVSFPDARKIVEGRQPMQGRSFAAVAAKVTKSTGTQTEVVHCTCQGRPPPPGSGLPTSPTRDMQLQTDVEADVLPGIGQVASPATNKPNSPRLSNKAAAIVAENKARLAEKQTAATAAKQAGLAKLGGKTSNIPTKPNNPQGGANGARPKVLGNKLNKTWKDTGSDPERAPKGSRDPITSLDKLATLSHESMDSLDPIDLPEAASGAAAGRGRRNAGSKKPT